MHRIPVSVVLLAMSVGVGTPGSTHAAIQIFLSPQDETDIGPIDAPVNHHETPFSNGSTNIWFRNLDDDPVNDEVITGASLNLVSTNPGRIQFTDLVIYNPHIDSGTAQDDRWQGTDKGTISANFIDTFFAVSSSSGFGMDPSLAGADPFYDPDADAWLFATVFYDVVGFGHTNFFLQIGNIGITTDGRSSSQIEVEFGGGGSPGDGTNPDPTLNGNDDRNVSSATPDGSVSQIPEPTGLLLFVLGIACLAFRPRRRI